MNKPNIEAGDSGESPDVHKELCDAPNGGLSDGSPSAEATASSNEVDAIRLDLVRQEHRGFRIILNLLQAYQRKRSSDYQLAAWEAMIWWLLSPTKTIAIGVSLVGILGLYVAYQANQLLDRQNFLLESDRRSALVFELSAIMDEIDEELDAIEVNLARSGHESEEQLLGDLLSAYRGEDSEIGFAALLRDANTEARLRTLGYKLYVPEDCQTAYVLPKLSDRLEGRIIAIDKAFKPYRYLDPAGELIQEPVSPERGQLLISLVESGVYLDEIVLKGDFSYADLQGANLASGIPSPEYQTPLLNFQTIILSSSMLTDARFFHVDLTNADLARADLSGTQFVLCTMIECDLSEAKLSNTQFEHCDLRTLNLSSCSLSNVRFKSCLMPDFQKIEELGEETDVFHVENLAMEDVFVSSQDWLEVLASRVDDLSNFRSQDYQVRQVTERKDLASWPNVKGVVYRISSRD